MLQLARLSRSMMKTVVGRSTFSTSLPVASHALDKFKEVLREYRLAKYVGMMFAKAKLS
jgi:hypothetical protein